MSAKSMSFKAKVNNYAKATHMPNKLALLKTHKKRWLICHLYD